MLGYFDVSNSLKLVIQYLFTEHSPDLAMKLLLLLGHLDCRLNETPPTELPP